MADSLDQKASRFARLMHFKRTLSWALPPQPLMLDVVEMAQVTLERAHEMVPIPGTFETIRIVFFQGICSKQALV